MIGNDPQYDEDIDRFIGDEIRVNTREDGTIISRVYVCKSCDGLGNHDASIDCEVYDDSHECAICGGNGQIEVGC